MGPCDEITRPQKTSLKNQKGSKFLENVFDEKVLINPVLEA
jgi:hypothetical protein